MMDPLPELLAKWHPEGCTVTDDHVERMTNQAKTVEDSTELSLTMGALVGLEVVVNPERAMRVTSDRWRSLVRDSAYADGHD